MNIARSLLGRLPFLITALLVCFCGSDQDKSKKNPQQPPPEKVVDPALPPEDWDGMTDWTGSAMNIIEVP